MDKETLSKLRNLEDSEIYSIGSIYLNLEKNRTGLGISYDHSFFKIFSDFVTEITLKGASLLEIFEGDVLNSISEDDKRKPLIIFNVVLSKNKFLVEIESDYLDKCISDRENEQDSEVINELISNLDSLKQDLGNAINEYIDEYSQGYKLGAIKEYQLIYQDGKSKLNSNNYIKDSSRGIPEQEEEIARLIANNIDKEIYDRVTNSNKSLIGQTFISKFNLVNGKEIRDIKFSVF